MIGTIIDSVRVSSELGLYVVTLREQQGKRSLHLFVESDEAKAIAAALDGRVIPELGVYDLLSLVIRGLSARVSMIVVSDCNRLKDKPSLHFNAKIHVVDCVKKFAIVSHATDAIAIAILTQTPVFVEESVMHASYSDALTQARINELSWLEVKDVFEFDSKELRSPEELSRRLLTEGVNMTGEELELVLDEIRHGILDYQHVVILTDKQQNRYVPIWMGTTPAYTIENLIRNIALANPYQLLCKIVEGCSSAVSMAFIDLKKDEYTAQLIFRSGDRRFGVDCRSSDAIIMALVANAPIYARKSLWKSLSNTE
jgi:bifunctional DNase/RNase